MSIDAFETALISRVAQWHQANYPALDLVVENGPIPELDKITDVWIDLSVRPYNGTLLGVGQESIGRETGVLSIRVFTREGEGTATAREVLQSLKGELTRFRTGGGWLGYPKPYLPTTELGWYKRGLMFPYTVDG